MTSELNPGSFLAHYRILSRIGAGGMGEVFLAEDTKLDRNVALKILPSEVSADPERLRRFVKEAKAASAVKHPNVAHIYEIGQWEDVHFIAMEYVEGQPLSDRIGKSRIDSAKMIDIAIQIADALEEAHAKGIIHRDIKPANVLLTSKGRIKVLDFGVARFHSTKSGNDVAEIETATTTQPGLIIGTLPYMSPEQALGKTVDQRSDLFSLGSVLYEISTGRLPFAGSTTTEVLDRILHHQPEAVARFNHEISPDLERMIRKCLEKDPDRRYQSARDLLVDLQNLKRDSTEMTMIAPPSITPKRRSVLLSVVAALVIAVVIATVFFMRNGKVGSIRSLAVLPFENTAKDPETEYLSDGITESLINSLSQLPGLMVVSRTSVFQYKGKSINLSRVADELKVQAVLTGRVLQHGENLTVSAELVEAKSNRHLWGEQYQEKLSDIFSLQSEIAGRITKNLRIELTGEQQQLLAKQPTEDTEAYQLYLKGRYYWNKATTEGVKKAQEYFQKAIDKDPTYALAYAGLADCYGVILFESALPPSEWGPKAKAAAEKTLQLDANLAEPYTLLANIQCSYEWNCAGAEKNYRRAIELNPSYAYGHHQYAWYLAMMKREQEAIKEFQRAAQLDPLSLVITTDLNVPYALSKQYDTAIQYCRKAMEMDPNFFLPYFALGWIHIQKAEYQTAIEQLQKARSLETSPFILAWLGYANGKIGNRQEAMKIIHELDALSSKRWIAPFHYAVIHLALGETDLAFEWLNKAYEAHDNSLLWLETDNIFDPIRNDPRFVDLLTRMNRITRS